MRPTPTQTQPKEGNVVMLMEVTRKRSQDRRAIELVTITPKMAIELLEKNTCNRPMRQNHINDIARQIAAGEWKFNGDSVKIDTNGDIADGQHRLWAVVEAKAPVDSVIVYGVSRDAFATIDTNRVPRSGGDIIALTGTKRHRNLIASALSWLIRYQGDILTTYRAPQNKITLAMIERAFADHPEMARAVQRCAGLRSVCNVPIIAFFYYVLANRNLDLAERLVSNMENPAGVATSDPFFKLRAYFLGDPDKVKDPLVTIALCIKAANAVAGRKKVEKLYWRNQGKNPEAFPELRV
jgi:hypothetical protein